MNGVSDVSRAYAKLLPPLATYIGWAFIQVSEDDQRMIRSMLEYMLQEQLKKDRQKEMGFSADNH